MSDKTYVLHSPAGMLTVKALESYDDAERKAKLFVKQYGDVTIYESVAIAKQPVPEVEIFKF